MKFEGTPSNVTLFPANHSNRHNSAYSALLTSLAHLPDRPIKLVVDFQRIAQSNPHHSSFSELLDEEMRLWAETIGRRTIDAILISHPFQALASFELTRLLYGIASKFHIPEEEEKKFTVVSHKQEINSNHIALLKGLGFSNFQVIASQLEKKAAEQIREKVELLRHYMVSSVGIQLHPSDCLDQTAEQVRHLQSQCKPDYICLSNHDQGFDVVLDNGKDFDLEFDREETDTLALGPDGKSSLGGLNLQHFSSMDRYRDSLKAQQLPVHLQL